MELQKIKRKGYIKAYYDSLETKYTKGISKVNTDSDNFVSYVSIKFI